MLGLTAISLLLLFRLIIPDFLAFPCCLQAGSRDAKQGLLLI